MRIYNTPATLPDRDLSIESIVKRQHMIDEQSQKNQDKHIKEFLHILKEKIQEGQRVSAQLREERLKLTPSQDSTAGISVAEIWGAAFTLWRMGESIRAITKQLIPTGVNAYTDFTIAKTERAIAQQNAKQKINQAYQQLIKEYMSAQHKDIKRKYQTWEQNTKGTLEVLEGQYETLRHIHQHINV